MNINLEVERITVVVREVGTDIIFLWIKDMTQPVWPYTDPLSIQVMAAAEKGEAWAREHFPDAPINVINQRG